MLHNSWAALFVRAADRILPSRMMETCNVIQHAGKGTAKSRRKKRSSFGFSTGTIWEERKEKKVYENTLNFIVFSFEEREAGRSWNYSSKNENWWGETKRRTMNAKTRSSSLVHPKIYFMPFAVCCCCCCCRMFVQFKKTFFSLICIQQSCEQR